MSFYSAALEPTDDIKKIYEPDFRLKYTVKVRRAKAGHVLRISSRAIAGFWADYLLFYFPPKKHQLAAGDVIENILEVTNPSSASQDLKFQALFHTYFRLPEGTLPSDVTIEDSLTGLTYKDKVLNFKESKEDRKSFTFINETDRVYANAPKSLVAKYGDSQQGLKLENTNLGEQRKIAVDR